MSIDGKKTDVTFYQVIVRSDKGLLIATDILFMDIKLAERLAVCHYGRQRMNVLSYLPFIGKRWMRWFIKSQTASDIDTWASVAIYHQCECGAEWCNIGGMVPAGFYYQAVKYFCYLKHKTCEAVPESHERMVGVWEDWQAWTKIPIQLQAGADNV